MNPLHKKIRLNPGQTVLVFNKPKGFDEAMAPLPEGVKVTSTKTAKADHIYWFVKNTADIKAQKKEVWGLLKDGMMLWIMHPKGTSGIQTDLTRDKGWDDLMEIKDLAWAAYIAFDDTYSAVGVRRKTEADKKREAKPAPEREIFKYADSATKTITLPKDMDNALRNNPKAKAIFDGLAFSHRREYVEWVVTAKREETRNNRIEGTIEKLLTGYKNPAGR